GTGDDRIELGSYYYDDGSGGYDPVTLDGIRAPVSVLGDGGTDELWFNDWGRYVAGHTYGVTDKLVTRTGIAYVDYDTQVERLRLNTSWGNDTVHVWATSPATAVTVSLKSGGWDVVNVGSPNYSLDTIQGPVDVLGEVSPSTGLAVDSVNVNDQA